MSIYDSIGEGLNPQKKAVTEKAREDQVQLLGGGYGFALGNWDKVDRFLRIGTEGSQFYADEKELTLAGAKSILEAIKQDPAQLWQRINWVAKNRLAKNRNSQIFALALLVKYLPEDRQDVRESILSGFRDVVSTGTDFALWHNNLKALGKKNSRFVKRLNNSWLNSPIEKVSYQAIKYRQRDGWDWRGYLRFDRPVPRTVEHQQLFNWLVKGVEPPKSALPLVDGFLAIQAATNVKAVVKLLDEYKLPWEAVPTNYLNERIVWEYLLPTLPADALLRQLPTLTRREVFADKSAVQAVVEKFSSREFVDKAKYHPLQLLLALKTYAAGKSVRGDSTWTAVQQIVKSLDLAFDYSFKNIPEFPFPISLGVDVSGSMSGQVPGCVGLAHREVAAALALIVARRSKNSRIVGFSSQLTPLNIRPDFTFAQAVAEVYKSNFASTNVGLQIEDLIKNRIDVGAVLTITDGEANSGRQPYQVLQEYRKTRNHLVSQVFLSTAPYPGTLVDPKDEDGLDIVGVSGDSLQIASWFITRKWGK